MSITDELREYTEKQVKWLDVSKVHYRKLFSIADRIDAEHQKALDEWKAEHGQMWLKGYSECHAELLEGNETLASDLERCGWIRLPKDADGVPIRFGDKVTVSWSEKVYEVMGFSYTEQLAGGKRTIWVDVYSLKKMRNIPLCGASSCHHYHAPTVEDVLREFANEVYADADNEIRDRDFLCAKYAKRLTLAEGED